MWEGRLAPEYRKPFDSLAVTNAAWLKEKAVSGVEDDLTSMWLPGLGDIRNALMASVCRLSYGHIFFLGAPGKECVAHLTTLDQPADRWHRKCLQTGEERR